MVQRTVFAASATVAVGAACVPAPAVAFSRRADRAAVDPVESLVTFVVAPPEPVAWQELTLVAVVAPATGEGPVPTGTVAFRADFIPVGDPRPLDANGRAETNTSIGAGMHTFDASYSGDGVYLPRLADAVVSVQKASSTVQITSLANPAVEGSDITWVVDVLPVAPSQGIPSGTVGVVLDGEPQGDFDLDETGEVVLEAAGLEVGSHVVSVSYGGDFDYLPSDALLTQAVVAPAVPPPAPSQAASSAPAPTVVAPVVRPLSAAGLVSALRVPTTLSARGATVKLGSASNPPVRSLTVDLVSTTRIRAVGSAAASSLGHARITVPSGTRRTIAVRLNRAGRRALRARRRLRVQVRLAAVDSTGHTVKTTIRRTLTSSHR